MRVGAFLQCEGDMRWLGTVSDGHRTLCSCCGSGNGGRPEGRVLKNTLTPLLLLQVDFGPLTPAPANYAPTPTGTSKCYSYSCTCNTELVSSVLQ